MNKVDSVKETKKSLHSTYLFRSTTVYYKELCNQMKEFPKDIQEYIYMEKPRENWYFLSVFQNANKAIIVSNFGTIRDAKSDFMISVLRPYATSTPRYVRDPIDFINILKSIGNLIIPL